MGRRLDNVGKGVRNKPRGGWLGGVLCQKTSGLIILIVVQNP